jgi:hypothetical protein
MSTDIQREKENGGEKGAGAPALTRLTSRLAALGRLLIRQGRGAHDRWGANSRLWRVKAACDFIDG